MAEREAKRRCGWGRKKKDLRLGAALSGWCKNPDQAETRKG